MPEAEQSTPVFEQAKAALTKGDYDQFYQLVTPMVANPEEKRISLMGPLQRLFPKGFLSCWNVVQRFEQPGLYQDVSFFDTGDGPLGLYLLGTVFNGQIVIMHFAYSDVPADMLDHLH